jgi:very-short-patch-repair endonuclease
LASAFEDEVVDFLRSREYNITVNNKNIIGKYELDIYLPEYNIAIECNGSYWHSERNGKSANYHLTKTNLANEKGIDLIHIWEHHWVQNKDTIKSLLLHRLRAPISESVYARKTQIKEISTNEAKQFLECNHIQGYTGASIKLGAVYNNEIIAVMTFGKARYTDCQWELVRYTSKNNILSPGLPSKLFLHFVRRESPETIVSYCDISRFSGTMYEKLGFTLASISAPCDWYTKDYRTFFHRTKYQKHLLCDILPSFDINQTAWENLCQNGYDRIWDCGNKIYKWEQ